MSTSRRRSHLNEARLTLREVGDLLYAAERYWDEMAPGMRAQSFDPSTTSTPRPANDDELDGRHHVSDPVGDAAVSPDQARRDAAVLDDLLRRMRKTALEAKALVQRWAVDRPASAKELQALALAADPGCEVVGRIERPGGGTFWEEVHVEGDCAGRLPRPYRLGAWAYKFVQRHDRLPTDVEARSHCEGRRVMVKA